MLLNLSRPIADCPVSRLHGPGWRAVIWVQGCRLLCTTKCLNSRALSTKPRYVTPGSEVLDWVVRRCQETGAEGLTVLGGEPTEQAEGLTPVLEGVRRAGFSTMVYSGHVLEDLRASGNLWIERMLAATDILVDGPFLESQHEQDLLWRGSLNQRILLLSERYTPEEIVCQPRTVGLDLVISPGSRVYISGMRTRQAVGTVQQAMRRIIR